MTANGSIGALTVLRETAYDPPCDAKRARKNSKNVWVLAGSKRVSVRA